MGDDGATGGSDCGTGSVLPVPALLPAFFADFEEVFGDTFLEPLPFLVPFLVEGSFLELSFFEADPFFELAPFLLEFSFFELGPPLPLDSTWAE